MPRRSRSSRFERRLEELVAYVSSETHPGLGMTNELLDNLARQLCPLLFRGVLLSGELLSSKGRSIIGALSRRPPHRRRFTLIVNLGSHFVTLHVAGETALYADSLGRPCSDPSVFRFVERAAARLTPRRRRASSSSPAIRLLYNTRPIQGRRSIYCGLYALLFARCLESPVGEWPGEGGRLRFGEPSPEGSSERNDQLCVKYLREFCKRPATLK